MMLPVFHSARHYLHAKSAHLYLQDMMKLGEAMPPNEFQKFTHEGYFTVHQTKKYWSGRFSDQVIECALMCPLKPVGGIIQRGIASNTTTRFTLGKVNLLDICKRLRTFAQFLLELPNNMWTSGRLVSSETTLM